MPGLADLLGGGALGGGGAGGGDESDPLSSLGALSSEDARRLSLVQALGQIQEAGTRRTASPIGAIANALLPLLTAPIAARQAEQQSRLKALPALLEILKLRSSAQDAPFEHRKLTAETSKAEAEAKLAEAKSKDPTLGRAPTSTSLTLQSLNEKLGRTPTATEAVEALQQQKEDVARASSATILERHKEMVTYDRSLPPKLTQKDKDGISASRTVLDLLDSADDAIASLPKDISDSDLAWQAAKYQSRSQHPMMTNLLTGATGGLVDAQTDPRLDKYFSWLGQVDQALAQWATSGASKSIQMVKYVQDHFPGYADNRASALSKAQQLKSDKSAIRDRLRNYETDVTKAARLAGEVGGVSDGGWIQVMTRNKKTGQKQALFYNPTTGQSSVTDPSELGDDSEQPAVGAGEE